MKKVKLLVKKLLPESIVQKLRRVYYSNSALRKIFFSPYNFFNRIRGRGWMPPGEISLVGDGDFEEIGKTFL